MKWNFWQKEKRKPVIYDVLEKQQKVDGKGRVYLPRKWRRRLGLHKGNEISLRLFHRWIEVHPIRKRVKD